MKPKSISQIVCYVKDLDKTTKFYETLGFRFGERTDNRLVTYVNWFVMTFIVDDKEVGSELRKEKDAQNKGLGLFVCITVDDIDEWYEHLLSKKIQILSKPRDMASGTKEFIVRDPDGYKIAIYQKK